MSELEYAGVVLEDQLLDHLATPEGARAVWRERLIPEVIPDSDQGIRDALAFVIEYMDEYREPPDVSVLMEETGFDSFEEPVAPIEYVIGRLRERYQRQQLKKVVTKIARLSGEPEDALRFGLDELSRIKMETQEVGKTITSDDLIGTLEDYARRLHSDGGTTGITLGYPEIDQALGGLRLGEVTIILARPKRYKSWQLGKSAAGALVTEHNVDFATMEMSETEIRDRITCMLAGVSWYRFQHGQLHDLERQKIEMTAQEMMEWPYKLRIHRPKVGERTVQHLLANAMENEAEALYIDQLSWFDGAKDEGNWRIIGKIMEELKDAAQHLPIYMAAQYNREAAGVEGIADLSKIGLADFIGQGADTLLGIYASKDMLANKLIHLGVVESRSFESAAWEIKIELSENSNFRFLNAISDDD